MTAHGEVPPPSGPAAFDPAEVAKLAGDWAHAVYRTAYSPIPGPELERHFEPLLGVLLTALGAAEFDPAPGEAVGARIVAASFTGAASLRVTVDTLGPRLLALARAAGVADPAERVLGLCAAVGTGYADALREWLFDQQEQVKQALLRAMGKARQDLARSEARFRAVFTRAAIGIALSGSDGALVDVNPRLADILGYRPGELTGRRLEEFVHPADAPALTTGYRELRSGDAGLRRRMRLLRADDTPAWVYLVVQDLGDEGGTPGLRLTMVEDVSDLHLLQGAMSFQSLHDALTNLPNRQYLISRLGGLLADDPPDHHVALYHLDLDGFAVINDGFGVEDGDQVLFAVARRLEAAFPPPEHLVARVAGDEFAVLVRSGGKPPSVLADVETITTELAEPVHLPGGGVAVSASIGVATARLGELDPIELIRAADTTLRRVQRSGRHQWAVHDPHRDPADREDLRLAAALPGALEFGQLTVEWQPWVRLDGERPIGAAARLRWNHPELGELGHDRVLDLAERTGASLPVGRWLLGTVCGQLRDWGGGLPAGLGLTPLQAADPDLIGLVRGVLRDTGLDPDQLWLGFPAAVLADELADGIGVEARENLEVLAGLGIGLVLTGVGAAAGDLAHAGGLAVRAVQFATGFARRAERAAADDPGGLADRPATALVRLADEAGLPTIVPGVTSAAAAASWRARGALAACGPRFGPNTDGPGIRRLLAAGPG